VQSDGGVLEGLSTTDNGYCEVLLDECKGACGDAVCTGVNQHTRQVFGG